MQPFNFRDEALWAELNTLCSDLASQDESTQPEVSLTSSSESYQTALQIALHPTHEVFAPSGEIDKCLASFKAVDAELSSVEQTLSQLITSLQEPSAKLSEAVQQIISARDQVAAFTAIEEHVTTFTEQVRLPEELAQDMRSANLHSQQFRAALTSLSAKITFMRLEKHADAPAFVAIKGLVDELRETALRRIQQKLEHGLHLLADPASSFEILRNALLREQRHLLDFAFEHEPEIRERISYEYVAVASKTVLAEMKSYCSLFAARFGRKSEQDVVSGISSLARGTSDMFSAIISETLGTSGRVSAASNSSKRNEMKSDRGGNFVSSRVLGTPQGSHFSPDICVSALRRTATASISKAELLIDSQELSSVTMDVVFHNCTAHFFETVAEEGDFLRNTFGAGASDMLDGVFQDSHAPLIALLEQEMEHAKTDPSVLALLLLTLFVSRAHRKRISNQSGIDVRILFIVQAEKLLQTAFIDEFDVSQESLIHMPDFCVNQGPMDVQIAEWVVQHAQCIQSMHSVVATCSSEIEASDLVATVRRKLQSFCNELTHQVLLASPSPMDIHIHSKITMHCYATLMSFLRSNEEPCANECICRSLQASLLQKFDSSGVQYAEYIVSKYSPELIYVGSKVESASFESIRAKLGIFRTEFEERVYTIAGEFDFLDVEEIDSSYVHAARKKAFIALSDKNNIVTAAIQRTWPDELHLVVPKRALAHAMTKVFG